MDCRHKWVEIARDFIPAREIGEQRPSSPNSLLFNAHSDRTMIICKCTHCNEQKIHVRPGDLRRPAKDSPDLDMRPSSR